MKTRTEDEISIRQRTCASCGHLCDQVAEFHPHMFCVLKKAGVRDPWSEFSRAAAMLGHRLPAKPPLVRDLRTSSPAAAVSSGRQGTSE